MTAEEFLRVLWNKTIDELTDEEREQYESDKEFINKNMALIEEIHKTRYNSIKDLSKFNISQSEFYRILLNSIKEEYDPFTIITEWVKSTANLLKDDTFVVNRLNEFSRLIEENDKLQKQNSNVPDVTRTCNITDVFSLTEGFLAKIDPSEKLLSEFKVFKSSGRIKVTFSDSEKTYYDVIEDIIHYNFNGTLNSASKLVHEFMHRLHNLYGHPSNDRFKHSLFIEYPSIFYENGMIDYMYENGFINEKERTYLLSSRFKSQYIRGQNGILTQLLKLCQIQITNNIITKEDILDLFVDQTEGKDFDDLTQGLVEYCKEHIFTHEHIGFIMYNISTVLAHKTPQTPENQQNVYKIAFQYIIDRNSDDRFFEKIENLMIKSLEEEGSSVLPIISTEDIGRRSFQAQTDSTSKGIIAKIFQFWRNEIIHGE